MKTETIEELLGRHPFFAGLGVDALRLMAGCASNVHFAAGEYIFGQGEAASRFYVIRHGRVALEIHSPVRGPLIVDTMDDGEVLGWSWLIPPYRYFGDARAVTPVSATALDGACLRGKCEADAELGYQLLKRVTAVMYQRLESARVRLLDLYGLLQSRTRVRVTPSRSSGSLVTAEQNTGRRSPWLVTYAPPPRASERPSVITEEGRPMAGDLLKDAAPPQAARSGWTTGRIVALATGSVLALFSLVLIAGCGTLTWADQEQLHSGYLTTSTATYSTGGYAVASDPVNLHGTWRWLGRFADKIRIRVAPPGPARPLFAGIATKDAAGRYLTGVSYTTVSAFGGHDTTDHPGTAPIAPPATALHWAARAEGTGSLTLTWTVTDGNWLVVVMNPDGSKGVAVRAAVRVSSPVLPALAGELLVAGVMLGLAAVALILVPVRLAARPRQGSWPG